MLACMVLSAETPIEISDEDLPEPKDPTTTQAANWAFVQASQNSESSTDSDKKKKKNKAPSSIDDDTQKKKHKALNKIQKFQLITMKEKNPRLTNIELADIAFEKFGIRPPKSTMSDIFSKKSVEKVKAFVENHPGDKQTCREKVSRVHALNEALALWVRDANSRGIHVSNEILLTKAKEIGKHLKLPKDFKYSESNWLQFFKKRVRH